MEPITKQILANIANLLPTDTILIKRPSPNVSLAYKFSKPGRTRWLLVIDLSFVSRCNFSLGSCMSVIIIFSAENAQDLKLRLKLYKSKGSINLEEPLYVSDGSCFYQTQYPNLIFNKLNDKETKRLLKIPYLP